MSTKPQICKRIYVRSYKRFSVAFSLKIHNPCSVLELIAEINKYLKTERIRGFGFGAQHLLDSSNLMLDVNEDIFELFNEFHGVQQGYLNTPISALKFVDQFKAVWVQVVPDPSMKTRETKGVPFEVVVDPTLSVSSLIIEIEGLQNKNYTGAEWMLC